MVVQILLAISSVWLVEWSVAAPICPPRRSVIAAQKSLTDYTLKINQIGLADRQTAEDFAEKQKGETKKDIESRYAATGDFSCGPQSFGQGSVAIKDDIVVTSAHIQASGGNTCPLKNVPIDRCKFTLKVNGKLQDYDVDRIVDTGHKCRFDGEELKRSQDWLVLKLKTHVDKSVRPYGINKDLSRLSDQLDVVQVAKSNDWNPTKQSSLRLGERHYSRCSLRHAYGAREQPAVVETDCDSSGNSSGGSVLSADKDPQLLGIVTGAINSCGKPDKTGPYRMGCWATGMTPISGEFQKTLESLGNAPSKANDFKPNDKTFKDL